MFCLLCTVCWLHISDLVSSNQQLVLSLLQSAVVICNKASYSGLLGLAVLCV